MEPLRALLFGLTIAAPVGPIALLLVHIGLNHLLGAALLAALGVAAADLSYAVVALTVGAALSSGLSAHRLELKIFSSVSVQAAYAGFGAMLQRWLGNARAVRRFNVASGMGIALFGLYGLARSLG
jgi:threonine/homoserine/homoserine lactone efflux protein